MPGSMDSPCQACGACCAYSADWPRFGLETEDEIAAIPRGFVDDARGTMRCQGDRCAALAGEIGVATACTLYAVRPVVCRDCLPGDDSCTLARASFDLPALSVTELAAR
jgi:Fe-S-cluster containining protein